MAVEIVNAQTTGMPLWTENKHKKALLLGLKIDNQHTEQVKINLKDSFVTDTGYTSGGSAYSASSLISGSAVNKFQTTVPAGHSVSFGKEDLEEIEFLGTPQVVAGVTTSSCIVVAQYRLG